MKKGRYSLRKRVMALGLSTAMILSLFGGVPNTSLTVEAASDAISNDSLDVEIGDLGQISSLKIKNNRLNSNGNEVNFVLPNNTRNQNNEAHQWMGEMIFSYRTSEDGTFPEDRTGFVEVDTNKTLAAGGSTTYSNATENLESNPYIEKNVIDDSKVEVKFIGQDEDSTDERTMKGFDVKSVYDTETDDGSLLWEITLTNKGSKYIEFGDVGLPMPWNNKYSSISDTYNNRTTVHTFAGADSGYAYAIRCSGEGNYMLFTPVPESGARIEYIDNWTGNINGVKGTRAGDTYKNWTSDTGGWFPGLQVYYIHSKDIQKTGRGYYTDATSLVLEPGESKTYQFKFSAVRAGDNTPQDSAESENNASDSVEEREANLRSIMYDSGMIDAVAVPSFQTALNMPAKLDLHYDDSKITDVEVDVQCVHENDPFDEAHIPEQQNGMVNNSRAGECAANDSATFVETKVVDGEQHHIYELDFGCIGNNSVRVNYKLNGEQKFTQYEFNVFDELDETIDTHADFMANTTQDNDPESATYGIYSDWYFASGKDSRQESHWGDDWSHDNINFMTMKNYLNPDPEQVKSIEKYLIDFMWDNYMKYTQDSYTVANYLRNSGAYSDTSAPYTRTYSEVMEATGFFNMYRLEKAYPDLIEYRQSPEWYLEKAYGIYSNRVGTGSIGFYGEQQIPDMIEALRTEGMFEEADNLQDRFARRKGTSMATAAYPYGSEFEYDNTGEEGAYAAAKALRKYYPDNANVDKALSNMERAEWKTRAMRGIQPTWYHYADPVFRGGESWWNFQYTASLAGSIMDDWLRYQDNGWDNDTSAWAQRVNYAAKISNFNAINMGQISDDYIGNVSWRYTMSKGGYGAQNVNDGGTRVQNNGWNDFSGESDEGLYGSLLRVSSDVVTDPVFGLTGYGCEVSKADNRYTIVPKDGVGKRFNVIDSKIYAELEQDSCAQAVVDADGTYLEFALNNQLGTEHVSKITLSGAGLTDGYYSVKVNGETAGQCFVNEKEGTAYAVVPADASVKVTIEKMDGGENEAPSIYKVKAEKDAKALVPFRVESSVYDDGAPAGTLTYKWEVVSTPEGAELTFDEDNKPYAEVSANLDGEYTLKLTVNDGELAAESELKVQVGVAPEKKAPVINEAAAMQNPSNTTVAELEGKATADSVYDNELKYEWSIVEQPEGGNAVIANADQANALMKANAEGTYTLRLTVTDEKSTIYDETISSYKDVVIEMTGNVDGVERTGTIITQVGVAPELPETMDIIYPDGTIQNSAIVWDEIAEEKYAEKGEFVVEGTVDGTEMKVAATVMVVAGESKNLALYAIPTAIINTPSDLGGVAGLNDGYDPANSKDKSHGVWHNWQGDQGGDAWVQYDWSSPVTIYQSNAYYFTDGNFVPKDVNYEYKDVNGNWRPLPNVQGCGNELDKYNVTTFDPVIAMAIRMNMSPKTLGCGVIEWQVFGYAENIIDKVLLKQVIDSAESLNLNLFVMTDELKAEFQAAIDEAKAVLANPKATQEEVDAAAAKLSNMVISLPTVDGNYAYSASASTSFVSSWEKLAAVNDGRVPANSYNPGITRYGTWGNNSASETVTYTWSAPITLASADMYLWYDGDEGNVTSGGIKFPSEYYYEYLDAEGNWQKVSNPSAYGLEKDKFNNTTFDKVTTTALRVTLVKRAKDSNGVGIMEWKVYGEAQLVEREALLEAIASAEREVEDVYTEESWAEFAKALEAAKAVAENADATAEEIDAAFKALVKAQNELEVKPVVDEGNIAPQAKADGICDYVNDLGGLATLNDNVNPTSSEDKENGVWHNWNHRYDGDGNVQNAWISYTWDETVELESTDVYYFTDGGGIAMPKSAKFEYLNEDGEWTAVSAECGCEANKYNTTELGNIKTKSLRLVMEPQFLNENDPAHGIGVIEWKVKGKVFVDKTALEEAIAEAETKAEADYTSSSWKTLEKALAAAKAVMEDEKATTAQVESARKALVRAIDALVGKDEKPLYGNIAPDAAADGICNYDGQDGRPNDLGGLVALNDGFEPTESHDMSHAVWHNWLDRYDKDGNIQNAWVTYTWEKPVELQNTDIYFFSDGGGIVAPESISFEYLDENGEWKAVEEAQELSCVEDEYTTVRFANIKTTAIRMSMVPQYLNANDPAHGVGIIEWKVFGKYEDEVVVNKDALNAAIAEAENRVEEDYTAESWAGFARALEAAKAVAADEAATQEMVDEQTALLNAAMAALVPEVPGPVVEADKTALKKLIDEANGYVRTDYTEESWMVFADALMEAGNVYDNVSATQKEVNNAAKALRMAIKGLEKAHAELDLKKITKYIEKAQNLDQSKYTEESWAVLESALREAIAVIDMEDATQEDINLKAAALDEAIKNLEKVKQNNGKGNGNGKKEEAAALTGDTNPVCGALCSMVSAAAGVVLSLKK